MVNVPSVRSSGRRLPARAGQVTPAARDIVQRYAMRVADYRRDHAVLHGDGEMNRGVRANAVARPACVQARMPHQNPPHKRDQNIGVRDCAGQLLARVHQGIGIYFLDRKEMGTVVQL
jgi:hypothetical protein